STALNGLPSALPFVMLFGVLVFSRAGSFREATASQVAPRSRRPRPRRFRFPTIPVVVVVIVAAALPPFLSGSRLLTLTTAVAFGVDALAFIHRPSFLASDTRFYYFVLAVVVVGVVAVELVRVTRLGRLLTGLADSPTAVGSLGISPLASRVVAFCFSAFLAA